MRERRVVITGIGCVCGLGVGAPTFWDGLVAGRSALRSITRFDPTGFRSRLAAQADGFTGAKDFVPRSYRKAVKVMARDTELTVAAAALAVQDAKLATRGTIPEGSGGMPTYPGGRTGCHIGAGLIAAEIEELTSALATARGPDDERGEPTFDLRAWGTESGGGGMNNLPPLWMLKYLPNMLACHVTIIHGAAGPSNTITAAQASAHLCISESFRVIERGDADVCLSGGGEAPVNHVRLMRFDLAGRLAPATPDEAGADVVRPYDPHARGGLLGEGAGILVLEERESAAARGATPYARVSGVGSSQSGLRPASRGRAYTPDGRRLAIESAIDDAGVRPDEIDAIVPEASGVPAEDEAEAEALRAAFGPRLRELPLVTLTPAIGDCMAGQGGLAVAAAALVLKNQMLPARLHAGRPFAGLDAGAAPTRPATLRNVLVTTGSVGGQNAAIVLSSAP